MIKHLTLDDFQAGVAVKRVMFKRESFDVRFGWSVKRLCAGVGGGRSRASCSVSGLWELSCSLRHCSKSGQLTPAAQSYWSIELETTLLSVLKTLLR